jgi:hypothetical protein
MKPCNAEIYEQGTIVQTLVDDRPVRDIQDYVNWLIVRSEQRIDWHYFGSEGETVCVIKALGDIDRVHQVIGQVRS